MKTTTNQFVRIGTQVLPDVMQELDRAVAKHPNWPNDPVHQWAIVQEEAGETQKEVLQLVCETNQSHTALKLAAVKAEAIQTAAMCLRFLAHLDDRG